MDHFQLLGVCDIPPHTPGSYTPVPEPSFSTWPKSNQYAGAHPYVPVVDFYTSWHVWNCKVLAYNCETWFFTFCRVHCHSWPICIFLLQKGKNPNLNKHSIMLLRLNFQLCLVPEFSFLYIFQNCDREGKVLTIVALSQLTNYHWVNLAQADVWSRDIVLLKKNIL